VSRVDAYQAAAARYGTTIVRAKSSMPPRVGGACTKDPLASKAAEALANDLRQLGAEATVGKMLEDARRFVLLAGNSFEKGDGDLLLP